jgi:hypothetical protein
MTGLTIRIVVGAVLGALVSFAYYKFVGCRSGTCPLTSNPYASVLFGIVMGIFLAIGMKSK